MSSHERDRRGAASLPSSAGGPLQQCTVSCIVGCRLNSTVWLSFSSQGWLRPPHFLLVTTPPSWVLSILPAVEPPSIFREDGDCGFLSSYSDHTATSLLIIGDQSLHTAVESNICFACPFNGSIPLPSMGIFGFTYFNQFWNSLSVCLPLLCSVSTSLAIFILLCMVSRVLENRNKSLWLLLPTYSKWMLPLVPGNGGQGMCMRAHAYWYLAKLHRWKIWSLHLAHWLQCLPPPRSGFFVSIFSFYP